MNEEEMAELSDYEQTPPEDAHIMWIRDYFETNDLDEIRHRIETIFKLTVQIQNFLSGGK